MPIEVTRKRSWVTALGMLLCFYAVNSSAIYAADLEVQPRHVYPARILNAQVKLAYRLCVQASRHAPEAKNTLLSPAGIAAVLSLLDVGASARMHTAIHNTLGFPGGSRIAQAVDLERTRGVWARLAKDGQSPGPLALANLLIFNPAMEPRRNALLQLAAAGADVEVEDVSKPEAFTQINNWVHDRTRGAIPSILERAPRSKSLIAINALYFADRWRKPFDPAATLVEPFHTASRDIKVRMMHLDSGTYRFRMDRHFIAVELPYETPGYSMVVITTRNEPASPREFAPVANWLSGENFRAQEGDVALPKFSLSDQQSILSALDRLGLRRGRVSPGALGGLSSSPMQISQILQRTVIKVDEKGTVAASATAAVLERAMPHDFVRMVVDKPFLFSLLNKQMGLVLVAGYIQNPKLDD